MSAKSVCVIFRSSLAPVVSLAYFCVDSGSGNVTDIEWLAPVAWVPDYRLLSLVQCSMLRRGQPGLSLADGWQ